MTAVALCARAGAHYNTEESFNYYVNPSTGSDSNAGTKALPFASLGHALGVMTAGQSVGLAAGTTNRTTTSLSFPGAGVRVGCYGCLPGASNMPIISGGQLVTGWTVYSGNVYSASFSPTGGAIPSFVGFTTGGVTTGLAGADSYYTPTTLVTNSYCYSSGTLYVDLGGTNPSTGTVEAATTRIFQDTTAGHNNIVFRGVSLRYGYDQAVALYNNTGHIFDRNEWCYIGYVINGGSIALTNYTNASLPAYFARITGNNCHDLNNDFGYSHAIPNLQVDHNTAYNLALLDVAGTAVNGWHTEDFPPGGYTYNSSAGLWVHHNTITLGPLSPKGCIIYNGYGGGPDSTTDGALIEHNTVTGGNFGISLSASNTTCRYNTCINQAVGSSWGFGGGIYNASAANGVLSDSVHVYNNVIYGSAMSGLIINAGDYEMTNWYVVNNTFVDNGNYDFAIQAPVNNLTVMNNIIWFSGETSIPGVILQQYNDGGSEGTITWDYNLIYTGVSGAYKGTGFGSYATYNSVSAWATGTGFDTHTITSNPNFTSPSTHVYTLQTGSPAIGAGGAVTIPAGATIWGTQIPSVVIASGGNIGRY